MSNATVSDQLQSMWRTRPYRLPQRGHIAGVAAGIGYRYGVDPVLIRVAFVVSTIFGGAGIVLYLAAWLVFNKAGDDASAAQSLVGKGGSSDGTTKTVVLVVALVVALTTLGPVGVGLGGSGVISMVAMLAGLWLLHQRKPEPPDFVPGVGQGGYPQSNFPLSFDTPYSAPVYTPPNQAPVPWSASQYRPPQFRGEQLTPYTTLPASYVPSPPEKAATADKVILDKTPDLPEQPTPPSWDPLGVAPFAWDLPEPAVDRSPAALAKRKRSRWTSSFIGMALLAAAVTGAVAAATGSEWLTPARIGAVSLAVIGLGLVIGAFLRKGYGLLVLAFPLLGFVVLASMVGPMDMDGAASGSVEVRPTTAAELDPEYRIAGGDLQLDLRNLVLTQNESVSVDVAGANATVTVPSTMTIDANCRAAMGSVDCGPDGLIRGRDALPDGPVLTIDGDVTFGHLEIIHD